MSAETIALNLVPAALPNTPDSPFSFSGRSSDSETRTLYNGVGSDPEKTIAEPDSSGKRRLVRPTTRRFLADFTLGFADGLTVPFALTAGLSSLGQSDTVIYAGAAEICAGCFSMGLGGYLAAKGEARCSTTAESEREGGFVVPVKDVNEDEEEAMELGNSDDATEAVVVRYLAPLNLPPDALGEVVNHVRLRGVESVARVLRLEALSNADQDGERTAVSPALVGLSVALGYVLGGVLPLMPYFFVGDVGGALAWSFAVCVAVLFGFGFLKDFFLRRSERMDRERERAVRVMKGKGVEWREIWGSVWEGSLMAFMGAVAAVMALLCVRLFESLHI